MKHGPIVPLAALSLTNLVAADPVSLTVHTVRTTKTVADPKSAPRNWTFVGKEGARYASLLGWRSARDALTKVRVRCARA